MSHAKTSLKTVLIKLPIGASSIILQAGDSSPEVSTESNRRSRKHKKARRISPSDRAVTVANRRCALLGRIQRLVEAGHSRAEACDICRVSVVSAWRWSKTFAQSGVAGLRPQNHKSGRRSRNLAKLGRLEGDGADPAQPASGSTAAPSPATEQP